MVRKFLVVSALLILFWQGGITPGRADLADLSWSDGGSWTLGFPASADYDPGAAGNLFQGGHPNFTAAIYVLETGWRIADLKNDGQSTATPVAAGNSYQIVFNQIHNNNTVWIDDNHTNSIFGAWTYNNDDQPCTPIVASTDLQFTLTVQYYQDNPEILNNTMIGGGFLGFGHDWLHDNAAFTLTGTLVPTEISTTTVYYQGELQGHPTLLKKDVVIGNSGYFTNLQLTYGDAPSPPAPTPLPGAVWLLGTGLLGLACLRRRLKP